jgi:hypothetical protein
MNDRNIHVSNTPIFDQLSRERGYDRLVTGGPTVRLRPVEPPVRGVMSFMRPEAWTARALPKVTSPKDTNARLKVNIHPLEAEAENPEGVYGFVQTRIAEFEAKHPKAQNVTVSSIPELDGTVTILIEGNEPKGGVRIAKPPNGVDAIDQSTIRPDLTNDYKGETFMVRGMAETLPPVIRTEFKTDPIPEDLSEQQLRLYKALSLGANSSNIPEQTDESVNAASTDVTPRPQYAGPRPLWFADGDTDEE